MIIEEKTTQKLGKWVCGRCGYMTEGYAPPSKCPVCKASADLFAEKKHESNPKQRESEKTTMENDFCAEKSKQSSKVKMEAVKDVSQMPREKILPILSDIEDLKKDWDRVPLMEQELAELTDEYQGILNRKPLSAKYWIIAAVVVWFIITKICSIIFNGEDGIGVGFVIWVALLVVGYSKIYKGFRESEKADREKDAEAFQSQKLAPCELELERAKEQLSRLIDEGKIDWAIDVVGEEIFKYGNVSDLIDLISSRRADNLKEALNLYDDAKHRERMEEMQAGVLANSDVMAMESAKQTELARKAERNSRVTAAASTMTAINSRKIYKNTKPKK